MSRNATTRRGRPSPSLHSRRRYRPALEALESRWTPTNLPLGFVETPFATGLSAPTSMDFAPDGRLFVTQQAGDVRVIENGTLLPTPFLHVNTDSTGERGLLGITFDPNFVKNHFVYVYYTVPTGVEHNRVSRFTANGDVALPGSEVPILDLDPLNATNHNGGSIHFGLDGKLYVGVGENANAPNSQTLANRLGKMLRLNPDGTIPTDNPFYNVATGLNRSIWALGLRNPFTFAVQPGTGRVFINDVGASTWEEIDDGIAGSNYGWPVTEGPTNDPRFRGPLFAYNHGNSDTLGNAITGGTFYNPPSSSFPSDFVGDYFFSDLTSGWIRIYNPGNGSVSGFATNAAVFPVDLDVGPDGGLYYLARGTGASTGVVNRIQYVPNTSPGQFRLTAATYNVSEGGGFATIAVLRTGGSTGPVSVHYDASGGTALNGTDYVSTSGDLAFADRETRKTFTVRLLQDSVADGTKTVTITLSSPSGTMLTGPSTATLNIFDDEPFSNQKQRFVNQVYLDLLQRPADQDGLAYWSGQLDQNVPHWQVVLAMESTSEYRTVVVQDLYLSLLGRPADTGGLTSFTQFLQNGGTVEQAKSAMIGSLEYLYNHGGGTSAGFLSAVYYDVLGRGLDGNGQAFFGQELAAGVPRAFVAVQLINSTEGRTALVQSFYTHFLRRAADPGGEDTWRGVLEQGGRDEQVIAGVVGSDEYFARL